MLCGTIVVLLTPSSNSVLPVDGNLLKNKELVQVWRAFAQEFQATKLHVSIAHRTALRHNGFQQHWVKS